MSAEAVISWGLIALVTIWGLLWTWDRIKPLVGIGYGLFVAPIIESVKAFKERYLLLPEDAPGYYVDAPLEEVVSRHTNTDIDTDDNTEALHARVANLTEREWVQLIASRKRADKWAWTGNKIYAMVGGDRNEVLGWIQEVRGAPEADPRFPESTRDGRPVASHLQQKRT